MMCLGSPRKIFRLMFQCFKFILNVNRDATSIPRALRSGGALTKEGPKLIFVEPYLAGPRRKSVQRGIARADRLLA